MAEDKLFSGESKNIEYKVTVTREKRKIHENSGRFCQWQRWKDIC